MHWCPDCGEPCYCDCDDTDFGYRIPTNCPHECAEFDDDDYFDDDEDEEAIENGDLHK